eukprot:PhM_4_TR12195/c0_g1_i1/m.67088
MSVDFIDAAYVGDDEGFATAWDSGVEVDDGVDILQRRADHPSQLGYNVPVVESKNPLGRMNRVYGHDEADASPPPIRSRGRPAWNGGVEPTKNAIPSYDARRDKHCVSYLTGNVFKKLERKRIVAEEVERHQKAARRPPNYRRRQAQSCNPAQRQFLSSDSQPYKMVPSRPTATARAAPRLPPLQQRDQVRRTHSMPAEAPAPMSARAGVDDATSQQHQQLSEALSKERAARCALMDKKSRLEKQVSELLQLKSTHAQESAKWKDRLRAAENAVRKVHALEQERIELNDKLKRKEEMYNAIKELYDRVKSDVVAPGPRRSGLASNTSDEYRSKALRNRLQQEMRSRAATEQLLANAQQDVARLKTEVEHQARLAKSGSPQKDVKKLEREAAMREQAQAARVAEMERELLAIRKQRSAQSADADSTSAKALSDAVVERDHLRDDLELARNQIKRMMEKLKQAEQRAIAAESRAAPQLPAVPRAVHLVTSRVNKLCSLVPQSTTKATSVQTTVPPVKPMTSAGTNTHAALLATKGTQCEAITDESAAEMRKLRDTTEAQRVELVQLRQFKAAASLSQKDRVIENLTRKVADLEAQARVLSDTNTQLLKRLNNAT